MSIVPIHRARPFASHASTTWHRLIYVVLGLSALPVIGLLIWQGITSSGNPDPTAGQHSHLAAILDTSVLVFREGLESILVLAAITAGLSRKQGDMASPIFLGASTGFHRHARDLVRRARHREGHQPRSPTSPCRPRRDLLAVVVLLVVMNWFFHKVYWGGWIAAHNRQKKKIIESAEQGRSPGLVFWGLVLLGLTSVYREGFEVVLFLQSYYLKLGGWTVLYGSLLGLALTLVVAVITFWMHQRMPYRKMLIITGVMLGFVLLVMVGEEAYEMQQAGWLSHDNDPCARRPDSRLGRRLVLAFPEWETIVAQVIALVLVVGSYFIFGRVTGTISRRRKKPKR